MADLDYDENDHFLDDANFVFEDESRRKLLADKMRALAGRGRKRERAFSEIEPFIDDFYINHDRDPYKKGNELLSEIIRDLQHKDTKWPIAPFLAWLSVYHSNEAAAFYKECGLADTLIADYRAYVGNPGERARERKLEQLERNGARQFAKKVKISNEISKLKSNEKNNRDLKISRDSDVIIGNKAYVRDLLNVVNAIARDSGMSRDDLVKEIDSSLRRGGFGGLKVRSQNSLWGKPNRWLKKKSNQSELSVNRSSIQFIRGSLLWLAENHPVKLQSYCQGKALMIGMNQPQEIAPNRFRRRRPF
ncbi:hypothetical protein OOT33_00070 [Sphingobium sp. DEHP117]|uniref:hypothetical protein n=1 Tax=Sphingobium sp. DEHP117 TaxID=2993436 RepID=UPI0027D4A718|nr:hypothetical protein [Sphingobium sp. DEHP117]MDQ4418842.1 hypothetical protein [Sphingobium sp. DEHP117]